MIASYTLALTASILAHPGASPCAVSALDKNPCWVTPRVPQYILDRRGGGRFTPGEICDGDTVRNTGAKDGVAFDVGLQTVRFDRDWLDSRALDYVERADGRLCIPTMDYGDGWAEPFACYNVTRLVNRPELSAPASPGGMFPRRIGPVASAAVWAPAASVFQGFGSGGGTYTPSRPGDVIITPPSIVVPPPVVNPEPPGPTPPAVPLPSSLWLLLAGIGCLWTLRRKSPL